MSNESELISTQWSPDNCLYCPETGEEFDIGHPVHYEVLEDFISLWPQFNIINLKQSDWVRVDLPKNLEHLSIEKLFAFLGKHEGKKLEYHEHLGGYTQYSLGIIPVTPSQV